MPVFKKIKRDFFKKWSSEMAYVLGFFAADGCMIRNNRGGHFIEFHVTDRDILCKIKVAFGSGHKIGIRPRHTEKWKTGYRLQIGSKQMFQDLANLGFSTEKSNTLKLPNIPQEFKGDFVRGYFDGDGCVYFKYLKYADRIHKRWVLLTLFTSGSRKFLVSLHLLLKGRGVQGGTIRKKVRGFDLALSHRDSLALYKLMYHTAFATGLFLPRKYRIFRKAIRILYPDAVVA